MIKIFLVRDQWESYTLILIFQMHLIDEAYFSNFWLKIAYSKNVLIYAPRGKICKKITFSISHRMTYLSTYRLDSQWCCFSVHVSIESCSLFILTSVHTHIRSQINVQNYEKRAWLTVHSVSWVIRWVDWMKSVLYIIL